MHQQYSSKKTDNLFHFTAQVASICEDATCKLVKMYVSPSLSRLYFSLSCYLSRQKKRNARHSNGQVQRKNYHGEGGHRSNKHVLMYFSRDPYHAAFEECLNMRQYGAYKKNICRCEVCQE